MTPLSVWRAAAVAGDNHFNRFSASTVPVFSHYSRTLAERRNCRINCHYAVLLVRSLELSKLEEHREKEEIMSLLEKAARKLKCVASPSLAFPLVTVRRFRYTILGRQCQRLLET